MPDKENQADMEDPYNFDEKVLEESMIKATNEVKDVTSNAMGAVCKSLLIDGNSVQDLLGLKPEQVEGVYGQAYRLFNNGQYDKAKEIFRILCTMDLHEPKYPLGVAACLHMQKKYTLAMIMYRTAAKLDPENPNPLYHWAECHIQKKEWEGAKERLEDVIKLSKNKQKFAILKDRAKMSLKTAEKMIATEEKGGKDEKKETNASAPKNEEDNHL